MKLGSGKTKSSDKTEQKDAEMQFFLGYIIQVNNACM